MADAGGRVNTELTRLQRVADAIDGEPRHLSLAESARAVIAYERAYALALLGFERVLWRCREAPSGEVTLSALAPDPVLEEVAHELPTAVHQLAARLDGGSTAWFRDGLDRLRDVRTFLERTAASCTDSPSSVVESLLDRHDAVQRAKIYRGRPKAPWVAQQGSALRLTLARAGGIDAEPTTVDQIPPHPYRLSAADALYDAASPA